MINIHPKQNAPSFNGTFLVTYPKTAPAMRTILEEVIGKNHKDEGFNEFH